MYRFAVRGPKDVARVRAALTTTGACRPMSHYQQPSEAGFGKVMAILSPFLICGGVVAYANYDAAFKKKLVSTVPAVEPMLNYFATKDAPKKPESSHESSGKKVEEAATSVAKHKFDVKIDPAPAKAASKPTTPVDVPAPQQQHQQASKGIAVPMPEPIAPASTAKPAAEKVAPKGTAPSPVSKPAPATPAPVVVSTPAPAAPPSASTIAMESDIQDTVRMALGSYQKAIGVLKTYNADVKQIIDGSIDKVDEIPWNVLKNRTTARNTMVAAAETTAREATDKLDALEKAIKATANTEESQHAQKKIEDARKHLQSGKMDLFKAKELSEMNERYWKKVEAARSFFFNEMESLFPDVNVTEKKLQLSREELDLFTLYAYSHVLGYQKELQKLQHDGERRLQRALDNLKSEDAPNLEATLEYYLEKEKREMALDNQKKLLRMREESEGRIRETLRRQAEAHVDHLNGAMRLKEQEMKRVFERELDDRLSKEQTSYKTQLSAYLGKMKGMEDALKARADADKTAHQSQALWAACQSLWSGVRNGVPGKTWKEELRPLKNEIGAVARAAEGDEFVKTVLEAVPPVAMDRGVFTEEALRERFVKVDQLTRRLALIKSDSVKLPMFILSYIQSMFILTPANAISKEELKDEIVDFGKLDTYDIMNRARYWMERGNLAQTVKYVNLLQGAPRKVAQDWLNEARLALETQQIVNTLMAHAASSGLLYL